MLYNRAVTNTFNSYCIVSKHLSHMKTIEIRYSLCTCTVLKKIHFSHQDISLHYFHAFEISLHHIIYHIAT